jgi:diacylglycerol kinase (ATP)
MENEVKNIEEKKAFSLIARMRSFNHAFRGIGIIFKTQHNAWVHIVVAVVVTILGFVFHINEAEWGLLVLSMFAVLSAEGFNTALEIDMDLTSPTYHPYAKDTKDVASGAVLLTAIGASIVGLIIFLPKVLAL